MEKTIETIATTQADTNAAVAPAVSDPAGEHLPFIKVDTALESLRASNFDTPAAVGEPIDNALQAGANNISIKLVEGEKKVGKKDKSTQIVEQIAIADDGSGMPPEVLRKSLILGYSSRYNERTGMGRFGVGSTLAGISQARRLELYSRDSADVPYLYSYVDLDEIAEGKQEFMPEPLPKPIPKAFEDLMDDGTGTLVVWSKCDRLVQGEDGTVHSFDEVRDELRAWISRTYRFFINAGRVIKLDGVVIEPHDPLFLMDVPRFPDDEKSEVLVDESFDWPIPSEPDKTSRVQVRMTLLPRSWRLKKGWGNPKNAHTRARRIHENEGISILRAKREIFYGISPKFYGSAVQDTDRWHGIEILFEPELDECFRVRNVKKGAEPVDNLREKLKGLLIQAIKTARERCTATYREEESKEKATSDVHDEAETIGAAVDKTAPKARAGKQTPPDERERRIDELARTAAETAEKYGKQPVDVDAVKERLRKMPVSIVDTQWPGKDFIEIEHLGTNEVVKINNQHPFFTEIYGPVLRAAGVFESEDSPAELSIEDLKELVRKIHTGLDLLIMAFARAEGLAEDATIRYGDLRTHWGLFLYNYVQELRDKNKI